VAAASCSGLAPGYRSVDTQRLINEATVHDVTLSPGGRQSLCLRIQGASPEQLAAATCAEVMTFNGRTLPLPPRMRSGKPDERGEWRLDDLPGDVSFREHIAKVPGAEVRMQRGKRVGQCFTVDFEVLPASGPAVLAGTLADAQGRPLANQALRCMPDGGAPIAFATDAAGAFSVSCPMSKGQNFQITAADPTLALSRRTAGGFDPKQSYPLVATPAVGVTLKLTDAQGRPVRGAEVLVHQMTKKDARLAQAAQANQATIILTTASRADGTIAIQRLPPTSNVTCMIEVRHPDGTARSAPFDLPGSGVLELPALQLVPCGTIRGTVRDAAGNPVPFAAVTANSIDGNRGRETSVRAVLTDKDGCYRFTGLCEGNWQVTFAQQQGGQISAAQKVQLKGGTDVTIDSRFDR
jgi:hypothetical protein